VRAERFERARLSAGGGYDSDMSGSRAPADDIGLPTTPPPAAPMAAPRAAPRHELLARASKDAASARVLIQGWQEVLAAQGQHLRAPPPEPTTCCGRGCNGCVWEGYFDAVRFWIEDAERLIAAFEATPAPTAEPVG
jgi:hypothetical protein